MNEESEINAAFFEAKAKFKPVVKSGYNPFHESRYATYEDIVESVEGPLREHGMMPVHYQEIGANPSDIIVVTEIRHVKSGQKMISKGIIFTEKLNAQAVGSCLTYSKRYGLGLLCGISFQDDDDGNSSVKRIDDKKDIKTNKMTVKEDDLDEFMITKKK